MAETASGILSLGPSLLRDLIAGTSAFQTWTSTGNAAAAKLRIHPHAVDAASLTRPFVVVQWWENAWTAQRGGYVYGALKVYFESELSEEYQQGGDEEIDYFSAALEHTNSVGAILEEACQDAEGDGAIHLDHDNMFNLVSGPGRPGRAELDQGSIDYYQTVFRVNFGMRL